MNSWSIWSFAADSRATSVQSGGVRVALLAESFLPHMNGVTNSVLQVMHHLHDRSHQTLLVAPGAGEIDVDIPGARMELLRSLPLPSYPQVRVTVGSTTRLTRLVRAFAPDVMHLASPLVLGWQGLDTAESLGIPVVAVYQTDVIAYAARYGVPGGAPLVAAHLRRLHRRATLTLAPSTSADAQLRGLGVDRVRLWGRGVDTDRFDPSRRSECWRNRIAPGEILVGYAGRLAAEKQVDDLRGLCEVAGVRLVIIGDGPARARLELAMPEAVFTGFLDGLELAEALASLDVFVHPGESETFCQSVQEAQSSGIPVVATGCGGPLDLVRNSVDGWLYPPGDLNAMRAAVADLSGDLAKARAFGAAGRAHVASRSWSALGEELVAHYADAIELSRIDERRLSRVGERPNLVTPRSGTWQPARRYVAVGDSVTEGLRDASRMADGEFRGWADRLAELLAHGGTSDPGLRYANLALRSRRVEHVISDQIPRAIALKADLVSVLAGGNDLVRAIADPAVLAARLGDGVRLLRHSGAEVLLVTPFLPRRRASRVLARRFALFNSELRALARDTGALLLDLETAPAIGEPSLWADDMVHLNSSGHRFLAYDAAVRLGVPDAGALGPLERMLHFEEPGTGPIRLSTAGWLRTHAVPWAWRRLRGRTAGDGRVAKHDELVVVRRDPLRVIGA